MNESAKEIHIRVEFKKEIQSALKDYDYMTYYDFCKKYGLETVREGEGFCKALKWVLQLHVLSHEELRK